VISMHVSALAATLFRPGAPWRSSSPWFGPLSRRLQRMLWSRLPARWDPPVTQARMSEGGEGIAVHPSYASLLDTMCRDRERGGLRSRRVSNLCGHPHRPHGFLVGSQLFFCPDDYPYYISLRQRVGVSSTQFFERDD